MIIIVGAEDIQGKEDGKGSPRLGKTMGRGNIPAASNYMLEGVGWFVCDKAAPEVSTGRT